MSKISHRKTNNKATDQINSNRTQRNLRINRVQFKPKNQRNHAPRTEPKAIESKG